MPKAVATPEPTPLADVTGEKKSRGAHGPRTRPSLEKTTPRLGSITQTARTIAARNGGYVNAAMIYRELASHPEWQKMVEGPPESSIAPVRAYELLTPMRVGALHKEAVDAWQKAHPDGDPYADRDQGGPVKGPFAKMARGVRASIDTDDL